MRVALLGAGTIAGLVLSHVRRGEIPGVEVCAVLCRPGSVRSRALAAKFTVPLMETREALLRERPQALVEAASHDAVREHLLPMLQAGVSTIVLSAGALADDTLRAAAEKAARDSSASLYVPSGGIGGLDALKAACVAGV